MITVTVDDLAFVAADAIARPVNAELRASTPVIRRLEQAAGDALGRQLRVNEPLEIGAAVVTGAGALPVPLMIHAVVSSDVDPVSRDGVRRAMLSALQRAHDFAVERLAVAPFGLGAGNLELEDVAATMLSAIREHHRRTPLPSEITIVVESVHEAEAFTAAMTYASNRP